MVSSPFRFVVNGVDRELNTDPSRPLLSALREDLGLTGAKFGCGEGACGACSVLVDGEVTRACVVSASAMAGRSVVTVEGLADEASLHPVQQAVLDGDAMQCGYCIPGMVVAASALLARYPDADEDTIRAEMQPNICRCCVYPRLMRAILGATDMNAAGVRRPESPSAEQIPILHARPREPWDLQDVADRDYFEVLGEGLVVVVPPEATAPGTWSPTGGAWLHVGADGRVTAFTGKVEVGQGTRAALQRAVARELRMPVDGVRIVMGDTDVCPFDIGTFGSLSMPTALPPLRIAAATARAELGRVGAEFADRRQELEAVKTGKRRVVIASADVALVPPTDWSDAGSLTRPAALQAVTGAKVFATDIVVDGIWHGRVLRPPAPGQRLCSADTTAAEAIPGVIVRHGDFVGVAASDASTAARALEAIVSAWEPADLVGEAALTDHLRTHPIEVEGWGGSFEHVTGAVDDALQSADVQLERTYTTAYLAHAPLETRVALAQWNGDRLTVWTATQQPFNTRSELARAFGLRDALVRVVVPDAGGGFGGKHSPEVAIEAARLARASGHPVQVRWTREEEFTHGYFRPASVIDVRAGATSGGALTAWEFTNINSGSAAITCPYEVANQRIHFQPADAPLRQGPYRALAATANHFARESMIDELAHALRVDPLEFRMRNLRDDRLSTVIAAATERFGWSDRRRESGVGAGFAAGVEKGGRIATCVEIRSRPGADDLEILRIVTAFECGAVVDTDNLRNQITGATIMGIGGALFEAVHFDRHHILNPRFSEYRVPRFGDTPPIEVVLVDRPDLPPAGGGETPIVAIAPALASALFDATGRRHRGLPLLGAAPGSR